MNSDEKGFFGDFKEKLSDFVTNRVLLLKLQSVSKASKLASMAITAIVVAVIGSMFLLFVSLMGGYLFSQLFDNYFLGFGLIALIYLILFFAAIFLGKKYLRKFIANKIINIIFDKTSDK